MLKDTPEVVHLFIPDFASEVYFGRNPAPVVICEPGQATVDELCDWVKKIQSQTTAPEFKLLHLPLQPLKIDPPPPRNRRTEA